MTQKRSHDLTSPVPRMQEALGVDTLGQLAARLEANLSTVKSWSARGQIPLRWLIRCKQLSGRSLQWLVFGDDFRQELNPNVAAEEASREWFGPLFEAFHDAAPPQMRKPFSHFTAARASGSLARPDPSNASNSPHLLSPCERPLQL